MIKVYKFIEDGWWDSNGCTCCEPQLMIYYTPVGFNTNGTPHDEEGCYLACIEIEDSCLDSLDYEELYELTEVELEALCRDKYRFEIEIEYMEGGYE